MLVSKSPLFALCSVLTALFLSACQSPANEPSASHAPLATMLTPAVQSLQQAHEIPGMAIAVFKDGQSEGYYYGLASKETQTPVTAETLFEIGSISKTFTATLAAYAVRQQKMAWTAPVSDYVPELADDAFGQTSLLALATHTTGGLPQQVPDEVQNAEDLLAYFKNWQPQFAEGSNRTYSNLSIGLLGAITADRWQQPFDAVLTQQLLQPLGLQQTFIKVPAQRMADYAQGYNKRNEPVRVNPGVFEAEAYGVKTTALDLMRFVAANMHQITLAPMLQQAIDDTQIGYYQAGTMTQGLIWESYPYPTILNDVLAGNADHMGREAVAVTAVKPEASPQAVLLNKTGGTGGFSAYAAFVPSQKVGVVILANKSFPIAPRVVLAQQILAHLTAQ